MRKLVLHQQRGGCEWIIWVGLGGINIKVLGEGGGAK